MAAAAAAASIRTSSSQHKKTHVDEEGRDVTVHERVEVTHVTTHQENVVRASEEHRNALLTYERSRNAMRNALGVQHTEVVRLGTELEALQKKYADDVARLEAAARYHDAAHRAAVGRLNNLYDCVLGWKRVTIGVLAEELRDAIATASESSAKDPPLRKDRAGAAAAAAVSATATATADALSEAWAAVTAREERVSKREQAVVERLALCRLLEASQENLAARELDVNVLQRQCEAVQKDTEALRASFHERELALSRRDAELQVVAAELKGRQRDVDDLRALLMRQVDDMRSISSEMKEDFGRILRESDERMSSKFSVGSERPASVGMAGVIPTGFVSTVTTDPDGTTHSSVKIQFVDVATGEVFTNSPGSDGALYDDDGVVHRLALDDDVHGAGSVGVVGSVSTASRHVLASDGASEPTGRTPFRIVRGDGAAHSHNRRVVELSAREGRAQPSGVPSEDLVEAQAQLFMDMLDGGEEVAAGLRGATVDHGSVEALLSTPAPGRQPSVTSVSTPTVAHHSTDAAATASGSRAPLSSATATAAPHAAAAGVAATAHVARSAPLASGGGASHTSPQSAASGSAARKKKGGRGAG